MNINSFVIAGRITMPLELRQDHNGRDVTSLPVAVNRRVKLYGSEEYQDSVIYFDIIVFGRTAKFACERLGMGSEVVVEGHHQNREIKVGEKTLTVISLVAHNVHWPHAAKKGVSP